MQKMRINSRRFFAQSQKSFTASILCMREANSRPDLLSLASSYRYRVNTIKNLINPFDNLLEDEKLYHLASGRVASSEIQDDLMCAPDKGETGFKIFSQERILGKKK